MITFCVKDCHPTLQICGREGHMANVCEVRYYGPPTCKLDGRLGHLEGGCRYIPLVLDDQGWHRPEDEMAL
jgi:hypothetical protein